MDAPAAGTMRVRRAALVFIFVTVLVDVMAFGLIIPVLPHLLKKVTGGEIADATLWHGLFATGFMAMQFIAQPVQGALSDRFGRRPVILVSNAGLAIDFLIMALAETLPLLFIARLLSGATSASFSTANAYIADVTPPEKRSAAFGRLGMAFGIGFTVSPVMGAWLGAVDLHLPFWVAAGLCAANFCYGWFVLPESLPPERRAPFDWRRANPLGSLRMLRRHPELFGLAGVSFLMSLAHLVYPTTFVLYADYRFGWGLEMVGWTLLIVGVMTVIVQGGLVGRVARTFGDRRTVLIGAVAGAIGFAMYAAAPTGYWFWAAMPVAALWAVAGPATQSLMTSRVSAQEQGRLQGAIGSLNSVAGIAGPTLFTQSLAWVAANEVRGPMAGASFWLAALMVAIGGLLAWRVTRTRP
ncbi:TCR/Tet family MFS transporter [Arenimonas caeni]|jgi:DHA1 family tetracycline resistance protein-like MFS transporter|uniref:Tetracycline resistance MFS efflux pump n=1 Tax=Arenimonas caeni TaxID=2058085 RepID=A0A2P6M7B2_9GAMM|nr:TCR/Tet family MFS transporter [Arenimonas caeni]MDY0021204.1 TCR/Tet family MFS transporter [Arenimonas caeni]PRH81884.1 tetracycline resistance MFS efflux pump [Arenimonas caeni]